jgi:uncharacterized protein (TIGR00730 family)
MQNYYYLISTEIKKSAGISFVYYIKQTLLEEYNMNESNGKKEQYFKKPPEKRSRVTEDERLLALEEPEPAGFTQTDPWRVFRIMGEFVAGFDRLSGIKKAVTIFGSARTKPDDPMYRKAVELAKMLGEEGFAIITGGGPGIMEAGNRGAMEAGAFSIGLNIQLPFEQHINPYVDEDIEFHYFFARKTMFLKYANAFVIFPGGFGTMDEFFESLVLIQTGKMKNFPVILMGEDYWKGLIHWLKNTMQAEGKISEGDLNLLLMTDSIQEAKDFIVRSIKEKEWRTDQEENARQTTKDVLSRR